MENLIKTTSFYHHGNDMWIWKGTTESGDELYNWCHGDLYDDFVKSYCVPDEEFSAFVSGIRWLLKNRMNGELDNDELAELIWIYADILQKNETNNN